MLRLAHPRHPTLTLTLTLTLALTLALALALALTLNLDPSPNTPGIQREGVRAMALIAERPELRDRLAAVSGLPEGLRAAAASRDAASAEAAADLLAALKL